MLHLPESSNLRKPIEAIQESGKRAATVVADLLAVASTREADDIKILIREYLLSPEYEKLQSLHPDVLCTEHLDAPLSVISCSPVHIKKTVMNLMANAIEAIGTIGDVHITTSNLKINSGENGVKNIPAGHYVVLSIQDNGPGISDEDVSHIFEPFYAKKILELCPEQKAVITSGFSEKDDIKATLKLGAHGFIKKPYSISQLGKVVKEALDA